VRVNATDTDIDHAHERSELEADGSFTVRYLSGPKTGLDIHFYSANELNALIGTDFTELIAPRLHSTPRTPPARGQWSQWEAVWQRRA